MGFELHQFETPQGLGGRALSQPGICGCDGLRGGGIGEFSTSIREMLVSGFPATTQGSGE
jgi:hypothetical protein